MSPDLGDLFYRAGYLLALAIAPPLLSPSPPPAGWIAGAFDALLLAAVLLVAGRLRARVPGRAGLAASALVGTAVAAALIAAEVFGGGDHGPLGRGVVHVAVPLWAGLAVAAAGVAARRSPRRGAPLAAAAIVAAIAAALFVPSAGWLASPERMWLRALRFDGDDVAAADALIAAPLREKRRDAAVAALDRCVTAVPGACACLGRRADVMLKATTPADALAEARAVMARCPASRAARETSAETIALHGDAEQAEQEARAGLEKGEDARLRYALALALDREGRRAEALEEARRAVKLGAGRDSALLVAVLAINAGDLDAAAEALGPVVAADPDDADAQYDLALVADRRNDLEKARLGYLAALRANPGLASARYNLAILALRRGALDEARNHVERFNATFPGDPRGAALLQRLTQGK